MAAVALGVASEVWMYRQALLMSKSEQIRLSVVTQRHDHSKTFPANGFDVQVVQGRYRLPRTPWVRSWCSELLARRNRLVPNFSASAGETRWWLDQVNQQRPDVCVAQFGTMAIRLAPLMNESNVPLVAMYHGYDLSRSLRDPRYCDSMRRYQCSIAAHVVCARYMQDALIDLGVAPDRIFVIPYGVPIPSRHAQHRSDKLGCQFIMVGRLIDKKRPDLVIRAFADCIDGGLQATLRIIGDGPLLRRCRKLVSTLQIDDQVEFMGRQPPDAVQRSLLTSDVFVQHSTIAPDGDKEGWPVAIAEAAALGLPIISTRHASIPEQVIDGVSGLLCEEGDWQTMGQHMRRLAKEPSERKQMGEAARDHIRAFNVEDQVRQLQDIVLRVADQEAS